MQRIVIIGGGFGGVIAAQSLAKAADLSVTLISDRSWLEYYGSLYRLIRSDEFSRVCIRLDELVPPSVTVIVDAVTSIDAKRQVVRGTQEYPYDTLIVALGAEPAFFGIPGMKEHALTMSHVRDAIRLRRHFDDLLLKADQATPEEREVLERVVVVGGGPTGVETASELVVHLEDLRRRPPHIVLLEAADRLLPSLPESVSAATKKRLLDMGVEVRTGAKVTECTDGALTLADGSLRAGTIVWTAGVRAHSLLEAAGVFTLDKRGRVEVDEALRAKGHDHIFILGDCAKTTYAGMAQTAVYDADIVSRIIRGKAATYKPTLPKFAIPVGERWAAVALGPVNIIGTAGYVLRLLADLKVFLSLCRSPLAAFGHFFGVRDGKLEEAIRRTI